MLTGVITKLILAFLPITVKHRFIMELDAEKMNPDVLAELEQAVNYQYLMSIFYCLSSIPL